MSTRTWRWVLAGLAVLGVVIAAALLWGEDDEAVVGSGGSTTTSTTTTSTTTTSTTTTSSTTTSATATPTPAAVSDVRSGAGGGSGEVFLDWDAAEGATGYRVLRAGTPEGSFTVVATIDVTTGTATAGDEVVNIWTAAHSYLPSDGPLTARDASPELHYVEAGGPGQRCFKVVAYNEGGDAPPSSAACGSPP